MGMKKRAKRQQSLSKIFIKHLLALAAGGVTLVLLYYYICFGTGLFLYANYAENYLRDNGSKIAQSVPFDKTLIPYTCRYGLYDSGGSYLQGNLKEKEKKTALSVLDGNETNFYIKIDREDGTCIIKYDIQLHFVSQKLHQLFPHPELMMVGIFFLLFAGVVLLTAWCFQRRLKREMEPLQYEISRIQEKELVFEPHSSGIKEFTEVLVSLEHMKQALAESLKKEWETEQRRKSNISAIAHDIKTPITIIKGSAQLMKEETELEEIYQSADVIDENTDKMERYLALLIQETKEEEVALKEEEVGIREFVKEIAEQSMNLCNISGIRLECSYSLADETFWMDRDLILRAVLNLVKNGVEHTKERLDISFYGEKKSFHVRIEDFGQGFSPEAQIHGRSQFYTEHKERGGEHYGLGLYIAEAAAKQYNGRVSYGNKEDGSGAVVEFEICRQPDRKAMDAI